MQRKFSWVCAAIAAAASVSLSSSAASAATAGSIAWQGGTGNLLDANYANDSATGLTPTSADIIDFGMGGVATYDSGTSISLSKLRVGTNDNKTYQGDGTLTISGAGTQINLTGGDAKNQNAALWVGNAFNGTLNIADGANITINRLAVIGIGNTNAKSATLNVTNGGSMTISSGNLNIADSYNPTGAIGEPGNVNISGSASAITVSGAGADMQLGVHSVTATYTQTDGAVSINDVIEVGVSTGDNSNTTLSVSGGTLTHGGNFYLGRGATQNATVNLSGTGVINTGGQFLIGAGTATGVTVNQSGGTLNITKDLHVGDAGTGDATYNLSGTGILNATTGAYVGRSGTAVFNQTGGQANFNGPLNIGDRQTATNPNSGLYKISAGQLSATALNLAASGTGEFRVIGDTATIAVNGDFVANSGASGTGTLAFELQSGQQLSPVTVSGTATFNAGSALQLDFAAATPTQGLFTVLSAADIVNNGLVPSIPAGWNYQLTPGGNGKLLKFFAGDLNADAQLNADDYALLDRGAANHLTGGADGDLNADGVIDSSDYFLIDTAYVGMNPAAMDAAFLANRESRFGEQYVTSLIASVPEPGTLSLLATAAASLLARRRRPQA